MNQHKYVKGIKIMSFAIIDLYNVTYVCKNVGCDCNFRLNKLNAGYSLLYLSTCCTLSDVSIYK